MELIQYYVDLNRALVELYITNPYIYIGGYLICAAYAATTICWFISNREVIIDVIVAFVKKELRG